MGIGNEIERYIALPDGSVTAYLMENPQG